MIFLQSIPTPFEQDANTPTTTKYPLLPQATNTSIPPQTAKLVISLCPLIVLSFYITSLSFQYSINTGMPHSFFYILRYPFAILIPFILFGIISEPNCNLSLVSCFLLSFSHPTSLGLVLATTNDRSSFIFHSSFLLGFIIIFLRHLDR